MPFFGYSIMPIPVYWVKLRAEKISYRNPEGFNHLLTVHNSLNKNIIISRIWFENTEKNAFRVVRGKHTDYLSGAITEVFNFK